MEYVFGTEGGRETLRTKGWRHSALSGWNEVRREYPDRTVTDRFMVLSHGGGSEDPEGNCYDWYEIGSHYRYEDRFTPQIGAVEAALTEMEILSMEQERQITDNEIAILELKEARNG